MDASQTVEQVTEQVAEEVTTNLSFFQRYINEIQNNLLSFALKVIIAFLVFVVGMLVIKLITRAINKALDKAAAKNNFDHMNFIKDTIKFVLYAILVILLLEYFGVTTASVVAILGSAGLTAGLAFQGALSNFAGGILLLINRPFKVGDYVIIGVSGTEGQISDIGIIYTTLIVGDQKTIVVPNGSIANSTITNLSISGTRFLELIFEISYSSDIKKAKSVIEDVVNSDEGVIKDKDTTIFVSELSDNSIKIGLRVYVPQSDFITVKWRLLENVKLAFDLNGIDIPFNQLDVHIK